MPTGPYICLYQILLEYFKLLRSYGVHKHFDLGIYSREITRKSTKRELSFLHVTLLLYLIYAPTKYHLTQYGSYGLHKMSASVDIGT